MLKHTQLRQALELIVALTVIGLLALLTLAGRPVDAAPRLQAPTQLTSCAEAAFSTEEEFLSRGPRQPDGIQVISGGDLLSPRGVVCMRNRQLLAAFQVPGIPPLPDLGLDAADVLRIEPALVAFSTELKDPRGRFGAGDLLTTDGVVIPNFVLMSAFGVTHDVGLDEVKFIGQTVDIRGFLEFAKEQTRESWPQVRLPEVLTRYKIDIWFSIEGTVQRPEKDTLLDGDILSAKTGAIVLTQSDLLAPPIPAGLPDPGVDFGVDAFAVRCDGERETVRFSTEIVYQDDRALAFTDGDLLKLGGSVVMRNKELINAFEPLARDLGLDAISFPPDRRSCGDETRRDFFSFLPTILKQFTFRR